MRDVLVGEDRRDLLPERARLARPAVVGRRLAHEVEAARRARARRVEEVAVAAHLVRTLQPRAERATCVVVEERRDTLAARQHALLETEQEHDLELARPHAHQVEHGNPSGLACSREPHLAVLERGEHVLRRGFTAERREAVELVEQPQHRVVGAQVEPRGLAGRRRFGSVRRADHRPDQACGHPRRGRRAAQLGEMRDRRFAELLGLLLDARRGEDRPTAQPSFDEVDRRAGEARVGRAEVGEQLAALAVCPRVAKELQERVPERRRAEPRARLDRVRHAERAEHRLERRAPAVERRRDERDLLGRRAAADQARAARRRRARACRARRRLRRSERRRRARPAAAGIPRRAPARGGRAPGGRTRPTVARAPGSSRRRAPRGRSPCGRARRRRAGRARRAARRTPRHGRRAPRAASTRRRSGPRSRRRRPARRSRRARSFCSRSTARRRSVSRSQRSSRSSSARYAA